MGKLTTEELQSEVKAVLKGADLTTVTAKVVRKQIEEKLGLDLGDRRKEIDSFIMAEIDEKVTSEEEVSEEEVEVAPKGRKAKAKDDSDEEEYSPKKPAAKKAAKGKKRKSGNESDEDWGKKKKKPKAAGGPRKQTAFTKSFKLSEELSELMGAEVMPRHEVVKKMWAYIKENSLQDPAQKQFAICDAPLLKVIGVKRFRTFGMMKYLKTHFVEPVEV